MRFTVVTIRVVDADGKELYVHDSLVTDLDTLESVTQSFRINDQLHEIQVKFDPPLIVQEIDSDLVE
jgi:hypothetical protein